MIVAEFSYLLFSPVTSLLRLDSVEESFDGPLIGRRESGGGQTIVTTSMRGDLQLSTSATLSWEPAVNSY